MAHFSPVTGRYLTIDVMGDELKVFFLENGTGQPLGCQHTAGCHNHQWRDLLEDPGPLDDRYQFALRASAETWRKFGEEVPPAMHHGIFAAAFRTDLSLEGDLLVLMQNLRCVVRQIELLRVTGVPV